MWSFFRLRHDLLLAKKSNPRITLRTGSFLVSLTTLIKGVYDMWLAVNDQITAHSFDLVVSLQLLSAGIEIIAGLVTLICIYAEVFQGVVIGIMGLKLVLTSISYQLAAHSLQTIADAAGWSNKAGIKWKPTNGEIINLTIFYTLNVAYCILYPRMYSIQTSYLKELIREVEATAEAEETLAK